MANIARIPITNVYMNGDYTAVIQVGAGKKPLNVILDTGSSALALDGKKYQPGPSDRTTDLAQTDSYGDGSSWTGAVIATEISVGSGDSAIALDGANAAIAYMASSDMFGGSDGILGLAYAALDDAFKMPADSWAGKYPDDQVRQGGHTKLTPYLTQLADSGVTSDKISFLTRRSFVHEGGGGAGDPLNQGWVIVGGGEESEDLYTGPFQTVKVTSDDWYSTNLKAVIVGDADPVAARMNGPPNMVSNSIVDSGTNSLSFGPQLLSAILSKFSPAQRYFLNDSILGGKLLPADALDLPSWPSISFVFEGETGEVRLDVAPGDYWQVNTQSVGYAMAAITKGEPGLAILGLPLMNGYFTIFDGEADGGRGAIKFAQAVR